MNAIFPRSSAAVLLLLIAGSAWAEKVASSAATHSKHIMIAPDEIVWGECPPFLPPGAQCVVIEGNPQTPKALFTLRSKLPDHYVISPHTHPTDEHITVISGTFKMGLGKIFDEAAMKAMPEGSFMVMPKKTAHFAMTDGETVVQVHAVGPMTFNYVNPADDPRHAKGE